MSFFFRIASRYRQLIPWSPRRRFVAMSYNTENIGDEIQSIAATDLLPKVSGFVDRERLDEACDASKLIMNGWFCHQPEKWPPSDKLIPLLISMHFTNNPEPISGVRANEVFARDPAVLEYLKLHGPVGARDSFTLEWLQANGIEAYYSGCLTLTLDRPNVGHEEIVILNDLPEAVVSQATAVSKRPVKLTTHNDRLTRGTEARMQQARTLLETYARAKCVLTTRLHGALPALAMGTPVLLIDHSWDQSRFTGLNELVHHCSPDEFVAGRYPYDLNDPPANPDRHLTLRADLRSRVERFVADA